MFFSEDEQGGSEITSGMSVTKLKGLFERLTKAGWGDAVLRCNGVNLGELRELRIIPLDGGLAVDLVTGEGDSDNV